MRDRRRSPRLAAAALGCALAAAALGACAAAPPAAAPPSGAPPSAGAGPSPQDPCTLLTDQEIATATGRMPLRHQAFTGAAAVTAPKACQWMVSGTDVLADLQVYTDRPDANFDSVGGGVSGDRNAPPVRLGDRSMWLLASAGDGPPLMFVARGATYVVELGQQKAGGFTAADAADYRTRTLPLGQAVLDRVR